MNKLFGVLLLALAFLAPDAVQAATCYWIGGTGNFDNTNTASWANASGGTTGTCAATGGIPKNAADTAIFDGSSGGGTVTVCGASSAACPTSSGLLAITTVDFRTFTGTLDFAANNPAVTLSVSLLGSGTSTRTFNMGDGVWTIGGGTSPVFSLLSTTGLTFNKNASTIVLVGSSSASSFSSGGLTYNALTINANVSNPQTYYQIDAGANASPTFASITVNAPATIKIRAGQTITATSGLTVNGSSFANPVVFDTDGVSSLGATFAVGAVSNVAYTFWKAIAGATSAINATNSYNLGSPTGGLGTLAITNPTADGNGRCIGC